MQPFGDFPRAARRRVRWVLTDIDDTLTLDGRLVPAAFTAMARLEAAGLAVVPITGRPAGWCDHLARMWPVAGVVGENGAFYFAYDRARRRMRRAYWKSPEERRGDRERLARLALEIPARVPGCRISADQAYREADLAVDFCEDVPPLAPEQVQAIVACFEAAGARAKVSSIHVNGWFGDYDKLAMTRRFFRELWGSDLDAVRGEAVFCGDSPNDEPMFAYFPHAIGVANVRGFLERMTHPPRWVTLREGGEGFAEVAASLLAARGAESASPAAPGA
jgi:HAD superfamily hydrolase (TIGR01484 family)